MLISNRDADAFLTQGDLGPPLRQTLYGSDGTTPLDLTDATVTLEIQRADLSGVVFGGSCTVLPEPAVGIVEYAWQAGDSGVPGLYKFKFRIEVDSLTMHWPNNGTFVLWIDPALVSEPAPPPAGSPVTSDPSLAPGLALPIGYRVQMLDGSAAWDKFGPGDTDWSALADLNAVQATAAILGPGLGMALAQIQGGNILVPDVDVAIGVPVTPAGIQRRLVFTIPAAATGEHTITLLAANAEIGSQITMVVGEVVAPGSIYSVIDEASGELMAGGPADVDGLGGWPAFNNFNGRSFVAVRSFVFDGTNWINGGPLNASLAVQVTYGGVRFSLGGIDVGL